VGEVIRVLYLALTVSLRDPQVLDGFSAKAINCRDFILDFLIVFSLAVDINLNVTINLVIGVFFIQQPLQVGTVRLCSSQLVLNYPAVVVYTVQLCQY